jgi:nucleoside-diphosphate-sugar epimerase
MRKERLLVIGANGQIGTVLVEALQQRYGHDRVIASDIRKPLEERGMFEQIDVLDKEQLSKIIKRHQITHLYHLAAILSAKGEQNPKMAWDINMNGLFNVLECAKEFDLKVFYPSSIAVFGTESPKQDTPQYRSVYPETVYGISKVAGEYWALYFYKKFGLDVRSVRYPGIISHQSLPGGGTTDYAVEIFHSAVKGEHYNCFLKEHTRLPMMYIPDAIRATIDLMEAPEDAISVRTSYNLAGMSFTPKEIAREIQSQIPDFKISYKPDFRQSIAETWTETIDDSKARHDWNWKPEYDLQSMTKDMIQHLSEKYMVGDGRL